MMGGQLTEKEAFFLFKQVLSGIEYLQSQKYAHRNLSLKSCMLTKDLVVKFTNFGVCRQVYPRTKKLLSYVGQYEYMAPEIQLVDPANQDKGNPWDLGYDGFKADLFAAGILLLRMVAGKDFQGEDEKDKQLYEQIGSKKIQDIWTKLNADQSSEGQINEKYS